MHCDLQEYINPVDRLWYEPEQRHEVCSLLRQDQAANLPWDVESKIPHQPTVH